MQSRRADRDVKIPTKIIFDEMRHSTSVQKNFFVLGWSIEYNENHWVVRVLHKSNFFEHLQRGSCLLEPKSVGLLNSVGVTST